MSAFSLLVILPMIFASQYCKDSEMTECGCIKRPTFEANWLQTQHPDVAELYKNAEFAAPTVTYPECTSINVACPDGFIVCSYEIATNKIVINAKQFPTPMEQTDLICDGGVWTNEGAGSQTQDNMVKNFLGCIRQ
ncbi:hypothetical protein GCK72_002027 [Caenorhabditis remanei]|uniref:DUF281 domain-containing protein n=1 Tax=Caenorhabditis remanei TaxID=31234 RepID=A0A6A5HR82_CAERE|nr:hypothetical protein GCK72_002027 [Caenorhabditis remanei]KAF1770209.1 hypothetical protein GCK72_002027 [Caenorhabditis remanei]